MINLIEIFWLCCVVLCCFIFEDLHNKFLIAKIVAFEVRNCMVVMVWIFFTVSYSDQIKTNWKNKFIQIYLFKKYDKTVHWSTRLRCYWLRLSIIGQVRGTWARFQYKILFFTKEVGFNFIYIFLNFFLDWYTIFKTIGMDKKTKKQKRKVLKKNKIQRVWVSCSCCKHWEN